MEYRPGVTGKVNHHWNDVYDWHKSVGIDPPGMGRIEDTDVRNLRDYPDAKEFDMVSEWQEEKVFTGTIGSDGKVKWDGQPERK